MGGRHYTEAEKRTIWEMCSTGSGPKEIGLELGRPPSSVSIVIKQMGLTHQGRQGRRSSQTQSFGALPRISPAIDRPWSAAELELLAELRADGDGIKDCSEVLSRSEWDVRKKAAALTAQETQVGDSPLPASGARGGRGAPAPARREFCKG
jgi:hypothetical protein